MRLSIMIILASCGILFSTAPLFPQTSSESLVATSGCNPNPPPYSDPEENNDSMDPFIGNSIPNDIRPYASARV